MPKPEQSNRPKRAAYFAVGASIIFTGAFVSIRVFSRMEDASGAPVLLFLSLTPYLCLMGLIKATPTRKGAHCLIAVFSCTSCLVGSILYGNLYPVNPPVATGGGATMAGLIFFVVPCFQIILSLGAGLLYLIVCMMVSAKHTAVGSKQSPEGMEESSPD